MNECPPGGSVLFTEGEYVLDMPLEIRRPVHLFGRGRVIFWKKAGEEDDGNCSVEVDLKLPGACQAAAGLRPRARILDRASLTGITIDCHSDQSDVVVVTSGALRMERCCVFFPGRSRMSAIAAGRRGWPKTRLALEVVDCRLSGGGIGVAFYGTCVPGLVHSCEIACKSAGVIIGDDCFQDEASQPRICNNKIKQASVGVVSGRDQSPLWALREGNTFVSLGRFGVFQDDRSRKAADAPVVGGAGAAAPSATANAAVAAKKRGRSGSKPRTS